MSARDTSPAAVLHSYQPLRVQKALLEALDLPRQHGARGVVVARGERAQIFALRPDPLRRVLDAAGFVERRADAARDRIHAVLLREAEGARERLVETRSVQQRTRLLDQPEPFELMAGLQTIVVRAQRQFGDAAGRRMHEGALDGVGQLAQRGIERAVLGGFARGEPGFGEMHHRVLHRRAGHGRKIRVQRGVEQAVLRCEAAFRSARRCCERCPVHRDCRSARRIPRTRRPGTRAYTGPSSYRAARLLHRRYRTIRRAACPESSAPARRTARGRGPHRLPGRTRTTGVRTPSPGSVRQAADGDSSALTAS